MRQVKFVSIKFRNFQSYGNDFTTVLFKDKGTVLIVGEDLDNTTNGTGSNGTGKSTILNALTYAIYDKPIGDITKDNLVNNINNKQMEVLVSYVGIDGDQYTVHRFRKMKAGAAGNDVVFYKGDTNITPDSVTNTNAAIERTIGLPYDLFVRIIVYSASRIPFLSLTSTEQKSVLEELFGTTEISKKADMLKRVIKDTEQQIALIQVKHTAEENERDRLATQLNNCRQHIVNWANTRTTNLTTLNNKLGMLKDIDFDEQIKLHGFLDKANTLITTRKQELRVQDQAIKTLLTNRSGFVTEMTHLKDSKCPYCKQQYNDTSAKIALCEEKIATIDAELPLVQEAIDKLRKSIETLTNKITTMTGLITVPSATDLRRLRDDSLTIHQKIKDLEEMDNPYTTQLDELLVVSLAPTDFSGINKLTTELHHQKFLLKLLTRKDSFIRKALLHKNLPFLNKKLQEYLKILGLPHKVSFTKEMDATIQQRGRALTFGNLSQGQAARVNFALSLAFRDVLQNLHPTINVFMLDEILDYGLDSVGVISAAKLVKQKAREDNICIYVISHRDEVSSIFDEKMIIRFQNDFSSIVPCTDVSINTVFGDTSIVNGTGD